MLLTIHDAQLRPVAFLDNAKQGTLHYFNDTWHRYLETASSTFDFTVYKQALESDRGNQRTYTALSEKAFVSFAYKGRTYLHTIRKVEEDERTIRCHGINLNLELINEYANPFKATKAMSFVEYCEVMELTSFALLRIGINEISGKRLKLDWDGTDTKLARLLSLANKFDAELEFDTKLNADSSIKAFTLNIYHEHDENYHGVGQLSPTILRYGKNLKTIKRTVDKTTIYNAVRPVGRDQNGNEVTLAGMAPWSVKNDKGEREFYQDDEFLFAPLSMQMYPSAFTSKTTNDRWIRKDMTVDSASKETIRAAAYRELKKHCYPQVTYEAEGFADLDVGDTVRVHDDGFTPVLLLEMRVSEQIISFTNGSQNRTIFTNFKLMENQVSKNLQAQWEKIMESQQPYIIKVATSNGTVFKNWLGESTVSATLYRAGKPVTDNVYWQWEFNGNTTERPSYTVTAMMVTKATKLTVKALLGNQVVATEEVTFVGVQDGVVVRLEQATVPTNPIKEAVWKNTSSRPVIADGQTYAPNTEYRYNGQQWEKVTVSSNNLEVADGFVDNRMIKAGAITVDKLNVKNLSALTADLGDVTSGRLILGENFPESIVEPTKEIMPAHRREVMIDKYGLELLSFPTKTNRRSDTYDNQMRLSLDHTGLSYKLKNWGGDEKPPQAHIGAYWDSNMKEMRLSLGADGPVGFIGSNYTDWKKLVDGVRYKVQGSRVVVDFELVATTDGDWTLGTMPFELVPFAMVVPGAAAGKTERMMFFPDRGGYTKIMRIMPDGRLILLRAQKNVRYTSQVSWEI